MVREYHVSMEPMSVEACDEYEVDSVICETNPPIWLRNGIPSGFLLARCRVSYSIQLLVLLKAVS
jgi:hypothetical protein